LFDAGYNVVLQKWITLKEYPHNMNQLGQQPVNTTHDYTNYCLYRVDPPDDEQQACSKHVAACCCNKLRENISSCWFILCGYITMHGQQNFKLKEKSKTNLSLMRSKRKNNEEYLSLLKWKSGFASKY
jgi:hypothetical protein